MRPACAIGVFAKAPIPGHAKTRLAPLLGAEGAARLQAQLIERSLATAGAALPGAVTLYTDGGDDPTWADCIRRHGVPRFAQQGKDLGARMLRALNELLAQAETALLIGSDCPALDPATLQAAAAQLQDRRMVFVPAEDGGYVLVGARTPLPSAFVDMPWGSDAVMAQTRARLKSAGWRADKDYAELPALWDLDRPEDYRRARDAGLVQDVVGESPR